MANNENDKKKLEKAIKQCEKWADDELHKAAIALAEVVAEEAAAGKPQVMPKKAQTERFEKQIYKELTQFRKQIEDGAFYLLKTLSELSLHDPKYFSEEVVEDIARMVAFAYKIHNNAAEYFEQLGQDKCLQELCGLSDDTLELFYQAAKSIYEQKLYKEAAEVLTILTLLNPNRVAFWFGLGNAQYYCHNFESALWAYGYAAHLDPSDPYCHLMSCSCYEKINEIENAINALDIALFVIGDQKEYADLKDAIPAERQRLAQKM